MPDNTTTIADLRKKINEFRARRGWGKEDPKDMALSLVLEASELLEHFQWLSGSDVMRNPKIVQAVSEEMSDVLWWLINLADRLGVDLSDAFIQKMQKTGVKYSETLFNPEISEEERTRQYYRIKAETRGGHPLYEPEEMKVEVKEKKRDEVRVDSNQKNSNQKDVDDMLQQLFDLLEKEKVSPKE
ncbi:MAG: hypothetical protein UX04_C0005G0021 [Microgenomates group bacterium GW2011_GWF2_45_18]|nr:MAG: hypothetical protein UW18_C0007G0022 [Microgenomates group bacterium GW2011_GWF1_44_10]KKU01602.1 MAG: hypothetical protein UX04_C0005G0021 [Microgenomates group bacterium GW2011_GWF2_45_18]OGJ41556.1 MAG: hypothetical protein A2378_01450 [Candidatus Pacebacteria bacterium RIFOXYB1_FULL_44_10]